MDIRKPGQYELKYTAQDLGGNILRPVVQEIFVITDTVAPIILLNGESEVLVEAGAQYVDAGAAVLNHTVGDIHTKVKH